MCLGVPVLIDGDDGVDCHRPVELIARLGACDDSRSVGGILQEVLDYVLRPGRVVEEERERFDTDDTRVLHRI